MDLKYLMQEVADMTEVADIVRLRSVNADKNKNIWERKMKNVIDVIEQFRKLMWTWAGHVS